MERGFASFRKSFNECNYYVASGSCYRSIYKKLLILQFRNLWWLRLYSFIWSCCISSRLWIWKWRRLLHCKKFMGCWLGWKWLYKNENKKWFWNMWNLNFPNLSNIMIELFLILWNKQFKIIIIYFNKFKYNYSNIIKVNNLILLKLVLYGIK